MHIYTHPLLKKYNTNTPHAITSRMHQIELPVFVFINGLARDGGSQYDIFDDQDKNTIGANVLDHL